MKPGRILFGLLLIALGVLFLLDRAGTLEAGDTIRDWWPAAIIAVGAVQLFDRPRSLLGPAIVMGVGIVLLLFTLDVVTGSVFAVLWPVLLIAVGLGILFRHGGGPRASAEGSSEDVFRATAVFGGHEVASRSAAFRGGSATAVFGGVEILVPKGWRVTTSGTPIFGGIENKAAGEPGEGSELRVDALSIFGGTEIKHEK